MDSQQPPEVPSVLQYATAKPDRGDAFAALYITLAVLCTIVGSLSLLVHLAMLTVALSLARPGTSLWEASMMLAVDGLLLAGSVGTFRRQSWARRVVQIASAGQVLIALILLMPLLVYAGSALRGVPWLFAVAGVGLEVLRLTQGVLCLWAFENMRADFWFGTAGYGAATAISRSGTAKPAPKQFKVQGIDRVSGQSIEYLSSAATADLAHQGAIALGLDRESIEIQKLVPANESPSGAMATGEASSQ